MRLLIHQALKDARFIRWLAVVWLLLIAALQVLVVRIAAAPIDPMGANQAARALLFSRSMLLLVATGGFVVIAALVVQNDPAVSTTAFWLTRPISRRLLLGGKFVVVGLLLVVLPVVADVVAQLVGGNSAAAAFGSVPASLAVQAAWLLPVMAIAAITTSLAQFLVATLGEAVLFVVGLYVSRGVAVDMVRAVAVRRTPLTGPPPLEALLVACFAMAALAILVFAYRTRAPRSSAATAGLVALVLPAVIVFGSPWLASASFPALTSPPVVRIDAGSLNLAASTSGSARLHGSLSLSNVPLRAVPSVDRVAAWMEYGSDRVDLVTTPSHDTRAVSTLRERATAAALGEPPPPRDAQDLTPARLGFAAYIPRRVFDQYSRRPGVLHVDARLVVDEERVAANIPVRTGETYDVSARTGRLMDVAAGDNGFRVTVRETAVPPLLSWPPPPLVLYAVRIPALGAARLPSSTQVLSPRGIGAPTLPAPAHLSATWVAYSFEVSAGVDGREWARNARFIVLESIPTEAIVEMTVPDVVLARLPGMPQGS